MIALSRSAASTPLPVIDISGLRSPNRAQRQEVGAAMREACIDKGFMYVVGHGVSDALVAETFAQSREFFALPDAAKDRYDTTRAIARRGYAPLYTQAFDGGPPDLKESFFFGIELGEDDPRVQRRLYDHGPNQWPSELPRFQQVMNAYLAEMIRLSEDLLRALALSLHLAEDYFDDFAREPMCPVRLLHYPPPRGDAPEGEKSFGAHTDFGGMTLLAQDAAGGLQIGGEGGRWIDATPIPGSFIVNLGDFVQRWTNDRYRSTVHRVISTGGDRYSIATFFDGNPEYRVECLPGCVAPGEAPRYEPTTMIDYLKMRVRKAEISAARAAKAT
jgi:isopenicillin N synthase-like dioxygenase